MGKQSGRQRQSWRAFIIQVALLCLLSLHGFGLSHKQDATEQDACPACQLLSHHAALDLPDAGYGSLLPLLVLLFLVVPWNPGVVPGVSLFARPRSRAPPSFFFS